MRPLKIYLCDLTHETILLVSDSIPVNIGYIGAYAKKVYGDFDTGQNPQIFNNFYAWEKNNKLVIYKRLLNSENLVDEEIFITNDEYDMKLGEFYYKLEQEAEAKDES